ncbi:MAG: GNAT family N-acetyltransferase [Alphaproteobacteria bacterium]|nr:GNAT family N-acetyltransferase [Alphaproteobacteria bacterium]
MFEFAPIRSETTGAQNAADTMHGLKVAVCARAKDLEAEWLELQETGWVTPYQSFDWVNTWQTAVSDLTGEDVRIVTIRDDAGQLHGIFPLVVELAWGTRVLRWLASSQINYGMPVMSDAFANKVAEDAEWLFAELLNTLDGVDAIHLDKQPATWRGTPNPLADLFTDTGANSTYLFDLEPDYDELYRHKRSKSTRRNNKRRDVKLQKFGDLEFRLPADREEALRVIKTLFSFVETRLSEKGIKDPYGPMSKTFYLALSQLPETAQLQLSPYFLTVGDEVVSVMMGSEFQGVFSGLVCSITDGPQKEFSPGDAALRRTIEACCKKGLAKFDFSAGHSDYKMHWAEEVIPLHDTLHAISGGGYKYVAIARPGLSTKRLIKRSDWLWRTIKQARKLGAPAKSPSKKAG